jgi:hypothetical protein
VTPASVVTPSQFHGRNNRHVGHGRVFSTIAAMVVGRRGASTAIGAATGTRQGMPRSHLLASKKMWLHEISPESPLPGRAGRGHRGRRWWLRLPWRRLPVQRSEKLDAIEDVFQRAGRDPEFSRDEGETDLIAPRVPENMLEPSFPETSQVIVTVSPHKEHRLDQSGIAGKPKRLVVLELGIDRLGRFLLQMHTDCALIVKTIPIGVAGNEKRVTLNGLQTVNQLSGINDELHLVIKVD